MKNKIVYVEPVDYFPKETRKKYKLGEYADTNVEVETKDTVKAEGVEVVDEPLETLDKQ